MVNFVALLQILRFQIPNGIRHHEAPSRAVIRRSSPHWRLNTKNTPLVETYAGELDRADFGAHSDVPFHLAKIRTVTCVFSTGGYLDPEGVVVMIRMMTGS